MCSICKSKFTNKKLFDKHVRNDHKTVHCVLCETPLTYNEYKLHLKEDHELIHLPRTKDWCQWCLERKHRKGDCPVYTEFEARTRPFVGGERKGKQTIKKKGTKYSHVTYFDETKQKLTVNDNLEIGNGNKIKTLKRRTVRLLDEHYPPIVLSSLN